MNARPIAPLLLALLLTLGALPQLAIGPPTPAAAQSPASILTLVSAEGDLWAVPEAGSPSLLLADVARGAQVTGLAWHPTRPEVLLVRQRMLTERQVHPEAPGDEPAPFDSLIRLDLTTGAEQVLLENVGPQARLVAPSYGPDGSWFSVRMQCCASFRIVFFEGGQQREPDPDRFLPADAREVALVEPGPIAPDGRVLVQVDCCAGSPPASDPAGLYLANRDMTQAQRLTTGTPPTPLGFGPAAAWVAGFRPDLRPDAPVYARSLVLLNLPNGPERVLSPSGGLGFGEQGGVAPDGTILVASLVQPPAFPASFGDAYAIDPTSAAQRNLTKGAFRPFNTFAWAPAAVLGTATPPRIAAEPDCAAALTTPGLRWDGLPMEPFTWSPTGGIEDLGLFDGQPATVCAASGPPDRLPMQNRIGCLLVGPTMARTTDDKLMCGAFLTLERPGSAGLLWVAHNSAATASVTGFLWTGTRFQLNVPTYVACKDFPLRPVQAPSQCGPG